MTAGSNSVSARRPSGGPANDTHDSVAAFIAEVADVDADATRF